MNINKKRSFFEKLTGSMAMEEEDEQPKKLSVKDSSSKKNGSDWMEEENEEAELTVDVYQTPAEIIVQTMVAGVRPDDLDINISRDMVTVRGKREETRSIDENNYFVR